MVQFRFCRGGGTYYVENSFFLPRMSSWYFFTRRICIETWRPCSLEFVYLGQIIYLRKHIIPYQVFIYTREACTYEYKRTFFPMSNANQYIIIGSACAAYIRTCTRAHIASSKHPKFMHKRISSLNGN